MRFIAKIKRTSHIHRNWRGAARIGGELNGVSFKIRTNGEFVTDPIEDANAVQSVMHHPSVVMEMIGPALVINHAPEPAPEPAHKPKGRPKKVKT